MSNMLIKRIAVVAGVAIFADVSYLLLKNIRNRFYNTFSLLMFGEKFVCSVKRCKDLSCSYHNKERLVTLLASARESLDICMYLLNSKLLCACILAAHQKGVHVRIIVDVSHGLHVHLQTLQRAGVSIGWLDASETSLMHHKFCIVDGRSKQSNLMNKLLDLVFPSVKKGKIVTGSLNWTQSALTGNYENILITNDPIIVSQYQKMFDSIAVRSHLSHVPVAGNLVWLLRDDTSTNGIWVLGGQ